MSHHVTINFFKFIDPLHKWFENCLLNGIKHKKFISDKTDVSSSEPQGNHLRLFADNLIIFL